MAEQNIQMKYWNGTEWVIQYPRTKASLVAETTERVFVTPVQRTAITDYLTTFNIANKLVQLNASGKIPANLINADFADYVKVNGDTKMSGDLKTTGVRIGESGTYFGHPGLYFDSEAAGFESRIGADSDVGLVFKISGKGGDTNLVIHEDGYFAFDGKVLKGVANPIDGTDAANKTYVDNLVSAGFKVKDPVKAASTANITITAALSALDGQTLAANDRVLIKNQTSAAENGVYVLNASKIPQKFADDSTLGSAVFIEGGSTQNDYIYIHSTQNSWKVFTKPDTIAAGSGLSKSGTTISVATGGITNAMLAGSVSLDKLSNFTSTDQNPNNDPASTSKSVAGHISNIYSMIRAIKGTPKVEMWTEYNLDSLPELVETKSKVYSGTDAVPTGANFNKGDLYIQVME